MQEEQRSAVQTQDTGTDEVVQQNMRAGKCQPDDQQRRACEQKCMSPSPGQQLHEQQVPHYMLSQKQQQGPFCQTAQMQYERTAGEATSSQALSAKQSGASAVSTGQARRTDEGHKQQSDGQKRTSRHLELEQCNKRSCRRRGTAATAARKAAARRTTATAAPRRRQHVQQWRHA